MDGRDGTTEATRSGYFGGRPSSDCTRSSSGRAVRPCPPGTYSGRKRGMSSANPGGSPRGVRVCDSRRAFSTVSTRSWVPSEGATRFSGAPASTTERLSWRQALLRSRRGNPASLWFRTSTRVLREAVSEASLAAIPSNTRLEEESAGPRTNSAPSPGELGP
jgi:hypothetical protein